jgi:hypothetical protein
MLPAASDATLSDADLLRFADQETQGGIVPLMMSVRQDYFTTHDDVAIAPGAAQNTLRIPTRAIGSKVLDVELIGASGEFVNVSQINSDAKDGAAPGFWVEGNTIVLYLGASGGAWSYSTCRLSYYQRPNRLVLPAAVGTISNIVGLAVTVAAMPATIVSTEPVDLVRAYPGHESLDTDRDDHAVVANTITFTGTLPSDLAIGDYVCLAEESPVPQLPTELQPVLVQRVVVRALEALNDRSGLEAAAAKLQVLEAAALKLIAPRVDGEPKRIVPRRGPWFE